MSLLRLYLDEDAQSRRLVAALRSRGVDLVTVAESGLTAASDLRQFSYAAENGLVLCTCNIRHLLPLHVEWVNKGKEHAGLILVHQQRFSVGERLRRILRIRGTLSPEEMRNRVEFLSDWG